jgi:hypothetical protein
MKMLVTFELRKLDLEAGDIEFETREQIIEYTSIMDYFTSIEISIRKFEEEGYKANLIVEKDIQEGSSELN